MLGTFSFSIFSTLSSHSFSWGNPRLNIATKPLFEETLDIVFECFEKYRKAQPLLPIHCLRNYKLIYNEDDDTDQLLRDDNQVFTERLTIRYAKKDVSSRTANRRTLPRVNTSRTSIHQNVNTPDMEKNNIVLPLVNTTSPNSSMANATPIGLSPVDTTPSKTPTVSTTPPNLPNVGAKPSCVSSTPVSLSAVVATSFSSNTVNQTDDIDTTIESFKHEDDIELERLIKSPQQSPNISKPKSLISTASTITRPILRINKSSIKRTFSNTNTLGIQRRKRIDLTPMIIDNRRYIYRHGIIPPCTETSRRKEKLINPRILPLSNKPETIEKDNQSVLTSLTQAVSSEFFPLN